MGATNSRPAGLRSCAGGQRLSRGPGAAAGREGVRAAPCWDLSHFDPESSGQGVSRPRGRETWGKANRDQAAAEHRVDPGA